MITVSLLFVCKGMAIVLQSGCKDDMEYKKDMRQDFVNPGAYLKCGVIFIYDVLAVFMPFLLLVCGAAIYWLWFLRLHSAHSPLTTNEREWA